jgi:hypothetical protein
MVARDDGPGVETVEETLTITAPSTLVAGTVAAPRVPRRHPQFTEPGK